jgi:4-hydroxybutyrate CoA-transferase
MKRIGVKYCGGCNPLIERSQFVARLKEELSVDLQPTAGQSGEKWDLGILVCGCPVACADRPEVRSLARSWIVVGGPTVEQKAIPEKELANVVALKIKKTVTEGEESS